MIMMMRVMMMMCENDDDENDSRAIVCSCLEVLQVSGMLIGTE